MTDVALAFARRLYHHVVNGGHALPEDLNIIITGMEHTQHDLQVAQSERDRLALEHSKAQRAILPWIEQVGWLNAAYDRHVYALKKIVEMNIDGVSQVAAEALKEVRDE